MLFTEANGISASLVAERPSVKHAYRTPDDGPEPDDAVLVKLVRVGSDVRAAGVLFDRHAPVVRRILVRTLGPFYEIEDHVQDTFVSFFKQLKSLKNDDAVKSYLIGIAVRTARHELRRRKVRKILHLASPEELSDFASTHDGVDHDGREALRRLFDILDELDAQSRLTFTLRYLEEMELMEVAVAVGESLASVKRRLTRVVLVVNARAAQDSALAPYLQSKVMFERKGEPPQELMDLARSHTSGDVSARRHQASRARVLDRWTAPARKGRMIAGAVVGTLALSTAAFAGLKEMHATEVHDRLAAATALRTVTTAPPNQPDDPLRATPEPPAPVGGAAGGPVVIHVDPETATVMWDGQELVGENHVVKSLPDQGLHRIRVSAVGYETKTINIVTRDPKTELTVKLNPLPIKIGEVMTSGAFPNTDEVVEGLRDSFRDCYTEGLALDPTITGKAVLVLDVTPDGKVRHSNVNEFRGLSTKVTTCVAYVGSSAQFEPAGSKSVMIEVPLFFGVTE